VSSSVLEQSSEPILEGLVEEGFADEDIESFPVAFAYDHDDPGGISEENAKIASLDCEVEQRRLRAARNSGGGQSKSSKGPSSEEEKKKKKNEKSTKTGTVAATIPKASHSGSGSGGQSEPFKGPSLVEEKKNQDENITKTSTAEVAAATPQVVRGGGEGQYKSSNGTSLVDETTNSTIAVTAAAAAAAPKKLRSSTPRNKRLSKSSSPARHATLSKRNSLIPLQPVDGFPSGWVSHKIPRPGSQVARSKDTYYYSPKNKLRFRSKVQARRFLDTLEKVGGDEMMAIERYQS